MARARPAPRPPASRPTAPVCRPAGSDVVVDDHGGVVAPPGGIRRGAPDPGGGGRAPRGRLRRAGSRCASRSRCRTPCRATTTTCRARVLAGAAREARRPRRPRRTSASRWARSASRKPDLRRLPFQFLRSTSWCAMLRSPVTTMRSPARTRRDIRWVIGVEEGVLLLLARRAGLPGVDVGRGDRDRPGGVSSSTSTQRPASANAPPPRPTRTARCGVAADDGHARTPLGASPRCGRPTSAARPASASTLPSSASLARTSWRQSTSGSAARSQGTAPAPSGRPDAVGVDRDDAHAADCGRRARGRCGSNPGVSATVSRAEAA